MMDITKKEHDHHSIPESLIIDLFNTRFLPILKNITINKSDFY